MIFKTIQSTNENGVTATNVVSVLKARKIAQEELNASIAKEAEKLKADQKALLKYEMACAKGSVTTKKFKEIMSNASAEAQAYAVETKGVAGSTQAFVAKQEQAQAELKATATATNGAAAALKSLSNIAINMIVMWGITRFIQVLVEWLDSLYTSLEEQQEITKNLQSELSGIQSELSDVNSALETTTERIDELNAKDSLSFVEQEELKNLIAENDELERRKKLLEDQEAEKKQEVATSVNEEFDKEYGNQTYSKMVTQSEIDDMQSKRDRYSELNNKLYDNDITDDEYKEMLALQKEINAWEQDTTSTFSEHIQEVIDAYEALNQKKENGEQLSEAEEEQLENYRTELRDTAIDLDDYADRYEIDDGTSQSWHNLSVAISDCLYPADALTEKFNETFNGLSDDVQNKLTALAQNGTLSVNDLSTEIIEAFEAAGFTAEEVVEQFLATAEKLPDSFAGFSFSDAWESLKISTDDATKNLADNLLELAKAGQLTSEALLDADSSDYFKNLGISADEAVQKINELASSSTQLNSMAGQISKISDMLADRKNGTAADASDLAGFDAAIQGLDSWEEFEQVMGSSKSTMEECQKAANALATEWINSNNFLSQLDETNKDYYITQLQNMDIANAETLVLDTLNAKQQALEYQERAVSAATSDMIAHTDTATTALLNEAAMSDTAKIALMDLVAQQTIFANQELDVSGKVNALESLMGTYLGVAYAAKFAAQMDTLKHAGLTEEQLSGAADSYYNYYKDKASQMSATLTNVSSSGSNSYKSSGSSSSSSPTQKETAETFDWIDTKLDVLSEKTEKLGTAFSKAFTLDSAKEKYPEYMAAISEEIDANNTAIAIYEQHLQAVGLSYEWIERIKSGAFDISSITDEDLKDQISEYQNWYDKIQSCYDNIDKLEEERLQAAVDYANKVLDAHNKEIASIEKLIDRRKKLVELKELFGGSASEKDLKYQQDAMSSQIEKLEEQNHAIYDLMKTTTYMDEAWQTYNDRLLENNDTIQELTQSMADLAVEMANLPIEKYEAFLDKNAKKDDLYSAKLDNTTSSKTKSKLIDKQMGIATQNNQMAQSTAADTQKNLNTSIDDISKASKKEYEKYTFSTSEQGPSVTKKKKTEINSYYEQIQTYIKKGKPIPVSLISKIAKDNYTDLAQACENYNAKLAANETAQATAALSDETTKTEIKDLAKQKANLPIEDYDSYIEKNDTKKQLNDAKLDNATTSKTKSKLLDKQIKIANDNNTMAQSTVATTTKNLAASIDNLGTAKPRKSRRNTCHPY